MASTILSLMLAGGVNAKTVTIDTLEPYEFFDYRFISEDIGNPKKFIDLDCQSFLHKLDFYENDEIISENYVSVSECQYLFETFHSCIKEVGFMCVDSGNLFKSFCDCQQ